MSKERCFFKRSIDIGTIPPASSFSYCHRSLGFTLIELSIVLVIIGLIIGGVLVGREMIQSASIRQEISQIQKYQSAANTFRLKYECLPGDCATASSLGLGTSGNGDGFVCGALSPAASQCTLDSNDPYRFWAHLGNAQLIDGSYQGLDGWSLGGNRSIPGTNEPMTKLHKNCGYSAFFWGGVVTSYDNYSPKLTPSINSHIFSLGSPNPYSSLNDGCFSALEAYEIDVKLDDGKPGMGKIVTWYGGIWGRCRSDGLSYQAAYYQIGASTKNDVGNCNLNVLSAF